jgi:hypothetical protein
MEIGSAQLVLSKQDRKHLIGLAGEFLVTGELLRREIMAAVTYGNAKKADVVAFHGGHSVQLEVKSTSAAEWVLGGTLPEDTSNLWVLVHLPEDRSKPPQYFVLTSADLRRLVLPRHEAYNTRYRQKYGKECSRGVVKVQRRLIDESYRGAWHKVRAALGMDSRDSEQVKA